MSIVVPLSLFYVRSAILNTFNHFCRLACFWAPHRPVAIASDTTLVQHIVDRTSRVRPDRDKAKPGPAHPWREWVSSGLSLSPSFASAQLREAWGTPLSRHVVCCFHWHLFVFKFILLDLAHLISLFHPISSPRVFLPRLVSWHL